jgi:hypothetical protein
MTLWQDPGTWIALGISALFVVVAWVHRVFVKSERGSPSRKTMSLTFSARSWPSSVRSRPASKVSLAAMRADAESRVLTRDFVGALRAKIAAGQAGGDRRDQEGQPLKGVLRSDFIPADIAQAMPSTARPACRC